MNALHGLLEHRDDDAGLATDDDIVAQAACVLMHRQRSTSHSMSVAKAMEDLCVIADATGVDGLDLAFLIVTASEHRARRGS
jgi:hypothetical protein